VESSVCLESAIGIPLLVQNVIYDTQNALHPGTVPIAHFDAQYSINRKVSSVDMVGGNPEFASTAQWAQRIATFELDPVNLYFSYSPVSNLIPDATKRANMARAIQEYIAAGAGANSGKKTIVDSLNQKSAMLPQVVTFIDHILETVVPNPPQCFGQGYPETGVYNGKSQPICYWQPQVFFTKAQELAPGQNLVRYAGDTAASCTRNANTGLLEVPCAGTMSQLISGPTSSGCTTCGLEIQKLNGQTVVWEYYTCCMGVNPIINKFTAQYGKAGSSLAYTCPPI